MEYFKSGLYQSLGRKSIGMTCVEINPSFCMKTVAMLRLVLRAVFAGFELVPYKPIARRLLLIRLAVAESIAV